MTASESHGVGGEGLETQLPDQGPPVTLPTSDGGPASSIHEGTPVSLKLPRCEKLHLGSLNAPSRACSLAGQLDRRPLWVETSPHPPHCEALQHASRGEELGPGRGQRVPGDTSPVCTPSWEQ